MAKDVERVRRIAEALEAADVAALVCTLPENVLMLSGYWPVVGTSLAVATRDGRTVVLVPEDERDLATQGFAEEVRTYAPGSLHTLTGPGEAIRQPLAALLRDLGLERSSICYENQGIYEPATYAALYVFGPSILPILQAVAPGATPLSDFTPLMRLRSRLTPDEVSQVRLACQIAGDTFETARKQIHPGLTEPEAALLFAGPMQARGLAHPGVRRAGAFTWCMSGPNSALAGAAYAFTRDRELRPGDLLLVHCNSYLDGYWTDITRTYVLGDPDERQLSMYHAIFAAREAALGAIRPGARADDVDTAARQVLSERGFGQYFTHGVGHNVGFSAISAEFPPRLHPASPDILEAGMTFNIEPSIYIHGYGGIRHCDVVTVHDQGPEVLTLFGADIQHVAVGG